MRMKKCLSILLAVVMIATMITSLPITANAVDIEAAGVGDGTMIEVGSATALEAACKEINDGAGGTYTISLTADIENGHVKVTNPNAVVTVIGNNKKIFNIGTAVYVSGGATVNLGDGVSALTLQGDNQVHKEGVGNDNPGIVCVMENSTCTMKANVTLKDHRGNNYLGGGVTVEGGTFHMYGGTIQNCGIDGGSVCYGGGVAVFAGGSFVMDNGLITRCYIKSTYAYTWDDYYSDDDHKINPQYTSTACGGGVFVSGGSSFTMNNGTISYNSVVNDASEKPYGDLAYGGGVGMMLTFNERNDPYTPGNMGNPQSSVVINGGTIIGNRAENGGGIYASGYYYCYNVPIGTKGPKEQVTANPGLFINDGAISENTATDAGGGIYVEMLCPWKRGNGDHKGAKTQIHNAEIINNTADKGAGIESYLYWTQMDIDNCTIAENKAATLGGGILLLGNSSSGLTKLKDTTITGNKSGDFGAGVFYDSASKLYISGANIIQNNKLYDENENKYYDNNLNVYSKDNPVYVNGALTGSQIGLSDPTLWDDNLSDEDAQAVSTDYLTSGYKAYNTANPSKYFTSDHDTWFADYSDVNTNEVRLVRKETVDYHINNDDIIAASYNDNNDETDDDIFTDEVEAAIGKEIKVGDTITSFYTVPEVVSTSDNTCPYIFKGWYYDQYNENDARPVKFGTDTYTAGRDIYAHWIKVDNVDKDSADEYILPNGNTYGGFDLAGVQIREGVIDTNYDNKQMPGGMRFITSLSKKVVNEINALDDDTDIEYGYVAATDNKVGWINYHNHYGRKLQYVSASANGINTLNPEDNENETYFGFATNVNCTSKESNKSNSNSNYVAQDHRSYDDYLLYTLVVTYEGATDAEKELKVLARPYIHYTDANGLERVAYSDYNGNSHKLGGCYISYNDVK